MTTRVASCEECGWIADASLVEFGKCPRSCATELKYYPVRSAEVDREAVAAALEEHGVLLFQPEPQCRCGHVYEELHLGGVSWKMQAMHRADAVLALLNGGAK